MPKWASLLPSEQVAKYSLPKTKASVNPWATAGHRLQMTRELCKVLYAAHLRRCAEQAAGSCCLHFEPAKICGCVFKLRSEPHAVMAPGQHTLAHTHLCSPLYLKHKRHLVVTKFHLILTLSAGLGFKMDVPILPTRAKPVCEADPAWAWVFLPGKSVVSFQMWVRVWAGVWALCSHDSSGYELRRLEWAPPGWSLLHSLLLLIPAGMSQFSSAEWCLWDLNKILEVSNS